MKYKNRPTVVDGVRFSSMKEASRYGYLKIRERIGEIEALELQPRFKIVVNGALICTYVGDFRYYERHSGRSIVEDVKGVRTPVYKLKKKLMSSVLGVEIIEV